MAEATIESEYVAQFPEFHTVQDPETGLLSQVREACYQIVSECYIGDTIWFPGEPIATGLTPNSEMQPLNKAAARNFEAWQNSLPDNGKEAITIEESVEAAMMLRNHPDVEKLSHDQAAAAVLQFARELKKKRGAVLGAGRGNLALPQVDARRVTGSAAPPMPNAVFKAAQHGMATPMGNSPRAARGR